MTSHRGQQKCVAILPDSCLILRILFSGLISGGYVPGCMCEGGPNLAPTIETQVNAQLEIARVAAEGEEKQTLKAENASKGSLEMD